MALSLQRSQLIFHNEFALFDDVKVLDLIAFFENSLVPFVLVGSHDFR